VYNKFKTNVFADDTGLEIDALNGRPGVLSARYAGPQCIAEDNINKVIEELRGKTIRTGRFRTVIALILDDEELFFEGVVEGEILAEKQGVDGFGYDPIFMPSCYTESFAEMDLAFKNKISHRAKAVRKLIKFLVNNGE
jgi:XTP/dITP diphosphohydrolase